MITHKGKALVSLNIGEPFILIVYKNGYQPIGINFDEGGKVRFSTYDKKWVVNQTLNIKEGG